MSGGSGARVNVSTLCSIQLLLRRVSQERQERQDQCDDDGVLGDCLPFELVWDPSEPSDPADPTDNPTAPLPPVSALDAVAPAQDYAKMRTDVTVRTVLFSTKSPLFHTQYSQECCDLLQNVFLMSAHGLVSDLPLLTQTVVSQTNFQVTEVTRVENKPLWDMHRQYSESYTIQYTRRVYHVTGQTDSITLFGFHGAVSKSAKFGRGIYVSVSVFPVLTYTELTTEDTLTFLVVQLHLGPVGLGKENQVLVICRTFQLRPRSETLLKRCSQVDFGQDPFGQQILTLTNPEVDIYCASHGRPHFRYILHLPYI